MTTSNAPEQDPHEDKVEQRWQALQERCIAITGKTMLDLDAAETMRVVNLFSTDDRAFALSYIGPFYQAKVESKYSQPPRKPRRRKLQPREERMTLTQAFELGNDKDDERAVRAAALLLDWASEAGNTKVDGLLAVGISRALYLAAEKIAEERSSIAANASTRK